MEKVPYGKYTKECRLETVRLVTGGGLSSVGGSHALLATRIHPGELGTSLSKGEIGEHWLDARAAGRGRGRTGASEAGTGPGGMERDIQKSGL